jgi:hypothetical protein
MPLCCLLALAAWLAASARGASAQVVAAPRVHSAPRIAGGQQSKAVQAAPRFSAATEAASPASVLLQAAGGCTLSEWGSWSSCSAARSFPRPPRAAVKAWTLPTRSSGEAYTSLASVCAGDGCLFLPDQRASDDALLGLDGWDDVAPPLPAVLPFVPRDVPDAGETTLRRCATRDATRAEARAIAASLAAAAKEPDAAGGIFVRVVWHVVHSGAAGNLSRAVIEAQVKHLNDAWAGAPEGDPDAGSSVTWWRPDAPHATGVLFTLAQVVYRDDPAFFSGCNPDTGPAKSAAWNVDTVHSMNVYSCQPTDDLLGWTTFPWDMESEGDAAYAAVFVRFDTLPGSGGKYGAGNTLVHEAGHFFGLLHVFEGSSCAGDGDGVDDTSPQAKPTYGGCAANAQKATCPPPLDNIINYSAYSSLWMSRPACALLTLAALSILRASHQWTTATMCVPAPWLPQLAAR